MKLNLSYVSKKNLAYISTVIVGIVAFNVSFMHIMSTTIQLGQSKLSGAEYPFALDALIVAGSIVIYAGHKIGWAAVAFGLSASLAGNILSSMHNGPLAMTWSSLPTISLGIATLVLEKAATDWSKTKTVTVTSSARVPSVRKLREEHNTTWAAAKAMQESLRA